MQISLGLHFSVMVPLFTNVLLSICLLQLSIALPFLLTSLILLQDEEDGNYDSGSECEEDDEEEEQAIPAFTAEEEDLDVYEVDDEWGTLVTDETKVFLHLFLTLLPKEHPNAS
ncbi:hypothetical protein ACHAW5_005397 [Stephanodiscus triporus]|uniref:Uncharacterized protein n=1 Tax=Stephanodiscus triporus TaxID=2934178 RepID=A0ABD3P7W3_9STRA